jgi:predicted ester cyclase
MSADALRQAVAHWNDPERRALYFDLYRSDSVWHNLPPELPPTLDGARELYARVWAAMPTAWLVIETLIESGDRLGCRYIVFDGADQSVAGRSGLTVLRFEAGLCVERWTGLDEAAFQKLLA